MKRIILLIVFSGFFLFSFAQKNIQGYISDKLTGEKLIGCTVFISGTSLGVNSNNYGFFSIKTIGFPVDIVFSYIGYFTDTIMFSSLSENVTIELTPKTTDLQGVEIKAMGSNVAAPRTGVLKIPISQIKLLPSLGGEVDVLKAFQLMPGVQGGTEGTSGLYVRGGTPDQNLILLDDIPLYFVNHIGGFVSVFDVNAINDVKLIKGGFPARYGGRLSSVVDIRMKTGNADTIKGEYGIGIIASRLFWEGPIINKKTKFMLSLRRCNIDLVSRLFSKMGSGGEYSAGYTFYDLYSKVTHEFNSKNSVSFSFYNGRDKIFLNQKNKDAFNSNAIYDSQGKIRWGNLLASLKWNHQYNHMLFGSLTFAYTRFYYNNLLQYQEKDKSSRDIIDKASTAFNSGVNDIILKKDFDFFAGNNTNVKFGTSFTHHLFKPGLNISRSSSQNTTSGSSNQASNDFIAYVESEFAITKKF